MKSVDGSSRRTSWGLLPVATALAGTLLACGGARLAPEEREILAHRVADLVTARLASPGGEAAWDLPEGLPADPHAADRAHVKIDDAPARGAREPLVTVVVFSDFECPFCGRVVPTLDRLLAAYPDDVALVFRHNPLPFHQDAAPAATAAIEGFRQNGNEGFWAMHDRLFASHGSADGLSQARLLEHGRAAGLDVERLRRALSQGAHDDTIARDQAYALNLGARGTPTFFLNGRVLSGAQPYDRFEEMVQEELAQSRRLLAAGVPRSQLYRAYMRAHGAVDANQDRAAAAPLPFPTPVAPAPVAEAPERLNVPVPSDAPVRGPENAPVTLQIFSDFECPFCARALTTLNQIKDAYPSQVRFVFRNHPLAFHQHAALAHEAAWEVYMQGGSEKFWAYHDVLFANQQQLTTSDLEQYAAELGGIRMPAFRRALRNRTHRDRVEQDIEAYRAAAGRAAGTPTFLVNGRPVVGAQPFEAFRTVIEDLLAAP